MRTFFSSVQLIAVAAIASFAISTSLSAQTAITCVEVGDTNLNEGNARTVNCALPAQLVGENTTASARVRSTGALVPSEIIDLPQADDPTSWFYLLDTSNPARSAPVAQGREFIVNSLQNIPGGDRVGVAGFDAEINNEASLGSTKTDAIEAANNLAAQGFATQLYGNQLAAIERLAAEPNDRKVLVVLSDGIQEDTAIRFDDVIEAAVNAGVIVHSVGFPATAAQVVETQDMRLIAERTGGQYIEAAPGTFAVPAGAVNLIRAATLGGGQAVQLESPSADIEYSIEVLRPGQQPVLLNANQSQVAATTPNAATEPAEASDAPTVPTESLIQTLTATANSLLTQGNSWIWYAIGAAGALLVLLLLLLALHRGKRRKAEQVQPEPFPKTPEPIAPDEHTQLAVTRVEDDPVTPPRHKGSHRFVSEEVSVEAELQDAADRAPGSPLPQPDVDHFDEDDAAEPAPAPQAPAADPETVFSRLSVIEPDQSGGEQIFEMTKSSIKVGRSQDNDLVLSDTTVHRAHAVIHRTPEGDLMVTDLNTKNGVIIDGERIDSTRVYEGTVILIGHAQLVVREIA